MAEVETFQDLLLDAVQDLYDAEQALVERLGGVVDAIEDESVAGLVGNYGRRGAERRERLSDIAQQVNGDPQGADNIWMRAVIDDAERDIDTVKSGRLLDIALVGAMRKGAQATRVSYETASALAGRLGQTDNVRQLTQLCGEHGACDDDLAGALARLTAPHS